MNHSYLFGRQQSASLSHEIAFQFQIVLDVNMPHAMSLDGFFCFSLHTGSFLLGWLGFASSFFSIIGWSLSFSNIDGLIKVGVK